MRSNSSVGSMLIQMLQTLMAVLRYVPLLSWTILKWFASIATLARREIRR